jgi:quercetin dioxygenase-like cupin family protein
VKRHPSLDSTGPVAHLTTGEGAGPLWGLASDDLNATLLAWAAGDGPPEHVNEERDVLLVVVEGSARLDLDGESFQLVQADAVLLPKGARRRVVAGLDGVRYLSVHLRRGGLAIAGASTTGVGGSPP